MKLNWRLDTDLKDIDAMGIKIQPENGEQEERARLIAREQKQQVPASKYMITYVCLCCCWLVVLILGTFVFLQPI